MGHKADSSFFRRKRAWSRRKDIILDYYLEAYLPKVRKLRRPVLLVDGFAGPGKFGDGEVGSPLILCDKARAANSAPGPQVRVLCIEPEPDLFHDLQQNVAFPFAEAKNGKFHDYVDEIRQRAALSTVFLYIDPYTPAAIDWLAIDRVSQQIRTAGSSVELLMNFNTPIFVRWALSALSRHAPDEESEDVDEIDPGVQEPGAAHLSQVVGGDWWRDVIGAVRTFPQLVDDTAKRLGAALKKRYAEVCWVAIKARQTLPVPKYHMFFGSRSTDALELMNDAMVTARGASDFEIDLFAEHDVDEMLLDLAANWVSRGNLILQVIRRAFCQYYRKEIRGRIEQLLVKGRLVSRTGKTRINDNVLVRRSP